MAAPAPFVSVVIPAYNRENYLVEAIRSVLEQTRLPQEIIVVDDGSTDRTGELARSFGGIVRCIAQENRGISGARNTGLASARGELLALLDSDDLWLPQKLEWQTNYLQAHPETDMVFGHIQAFLSTELESRCGRQIDSTIVPGAIATTFLVRRSAWEKTGPFRSETEPAEFIDWYSRAEDGGCTAFTLPELVARRRAHLNNTGMDFVRLKSNFTHALKSILDRRRDAESAR